MLKHFIVRRSVFDAAAATILEQRQQLARDTTERIEAINAARSERARADKAERQLRRAREDGVQLEATNDQLSAELMIARRELATERVKREAAERQATIAQNSFEWARLALNRAEQQAAELMAHALRTSVVTPMQIERTTTPADAKDMLGMGLPSTGDLHFEDIGDEAARREGAEWDSEGVVSYGTNGSGRHQ